MATTTNYTWDLPTVGGDEDAWGTKLNSNWTALDTLLGGVNATEFAILDGATVTTAELNLLDGVTATTAELNILDGVTSTATELNLLDGLTAVSGADLTLITGTAGGSAVLASWNADGDIVGSGFSVIDQDDMASDSATAVPTQQSVKAYVDASGAPGFTSTEQTITNGSGLNVAHGLGAKPTRVEAVLICKTAEDGWAVGDEVALPSKDAVSSSVFNFIMGWDATNVTVVTCASGVQIANKSTGAAVSLTNANWRIIVRAWA